MAPLNILRPTWARLNRVSIVKLAAASVNEYVSTNCSQLAAGVALFTMLSILPLLMLMVSAVQPAIHPLMPNYDIRVGIERFVQVTFSPVVRRWMQEVLLSLKRNSLVVDGFTLLAFGWAAVGAFGQLDTAFHQIWQANPAGSPFNLRVMVISQVRQRRNAVLFLLLALASFISAHFVGVEEVTVQRELPTGSSLWFTQVAPPLFTWLIGVFFLTLLYRWLLPGVVTWKAALLGAMVGTSLNLVVKFLVTHFVDSTIGASTVNIGGPLALVLGIYLIVQNILIGSIVVRQFMLAKSATSANTSPRQ